jgi:hypothetical protein
MPADHLDWLGPLAGPVRIAASILQPGVDALLRAPAWTGWALIGLTALLFVLGRQGQRLVVAALAGGACALAQDRLHLDLPGPPHAVSFATGGAVGFLLPRWARSLLFAVGGYAVGMPFARMFDLTPLVGALPMAAVGFAISWAWDNGLSLVLPPLAGGLSLAAGLGRLGVAHGRAGPLLVVAAIAAAVLVPLAIEREVLVTRFRVARAARAEAKKKEAAKAARRPAPKPT